MASVSLLRDRQAKREKGFLDGRGKKLNLPRVAAAIAEFERDLIRERTGDGRKRAMAKGDKFGRKPKLSDYQRKEALTRRAAGETLA